MNWTIQQIAIFTWFCNAAISDVAMSLVVRARAGTGKTTSIIEAVKRFVEAALAAGRNPQILVCAFNKIIADELTSRLAGIRGATSKTLHSLGNLFVMKALGKRKPRSVDGGMGRSRYLALKACPRASDDAIDMIATLNQKGREIEPFAKCGKDLEGLAYQFDCIPDRDLELEGFDLAAICNAAHQAMVIGAGDFTSMDYADMIFWPLVNRWVFPMYDLTVVDEAQDMTRAQLELALQATRETGHVVLVGDDCQAIYGFRGADSGSLDRLKAELQGDELGLTVTYRCPKSVVAMARKLVPDYQVSDDAPDGTIVDSSIDKLLANACAGDFVLSRTNAPLAGLCLAMIRDGKRAYIRGREIGKGITAVVKKLRIKEVADLHTAVEQWRDREIDRANRKGESGKTQAEIVADKAEVIIALSDGCTSINELIARIESMFETPKAGERDNRIMLATVHKAKGLEATNVYLLEKTFKRKGPEESNIRYVAITRTKSSLNLVQDDASPAELAV